jgi:peptide-methionine (R)-S-oxide reductase
MPHRQESLGLTTLAGTSTFMRCPSQDASAATGAAHFQVTHNDAAWPHRLSPATYDVLHEAGIKYSFTLSLPYQERSELFKCAGWAFPLYSSATKYDSRTGWPSFWVSLPHAIDTVPDNNFGSEQTVIHYSGYIGHIVMNSPPPTGLRYFINGVALKFVPKEA